MQHLLISKRIRKEINCFKESIISISIHFKLYKLKLNLNEYGKVYGLWKKKVITVFLYLFIDILKKIKKEWVG